MLQRKAFFMKIDPTTYDLFNKNYYLFFGTLKKPNSTDIC